MPRVGQAFYIVLIIDVHVSTSLSRMLTIATAEAPASTAAFISPFLTPRDRTHSRSCLLFPLSAC
jgi:hypothetical protein